MSFAQALSKSVNTVAVQLCLKLGSDSVVQVARRLGIVSDLAAVPSLALGTSGVSVLELVSAYAPFASGGHGAMVHGVKRISDLQGHVLYERSGSGLGEVISAENAGSMNRMLAEALRSGTGKAASLGARPAAGKTGTSQEYKDAWFVGYTRQLIAGVWLGNDSNQPMKKEIRGGTLPAVVWKNFMMAATAGQPIMPLPGTNVVDPPSDDTEAVAAFDNLLNGLFKNGDGDSRQQQLQP